MRPPNIGDRFARSNPIAISRRAESALYLQWGSVCQCIPPTPGCVSVGRDGQIPADRDGNYCRTQYRTVAITQGLSIAYTWNYPRMTLTTVLCRPRHWRGFHSLLSRNGVKLLLGKEFPSRREGPMAGPENSTRLRFGGFVVDLATGELFSHGVRVSLQDKPFQILALLLRRPKQLVSRSEIIRTVWPGLFIEGTCALT